MQFESDGRGKNEGSRKRGNRMSGKLNGTWPVLTTYDGEHLRRIALPLGGIGTGTVSLGGRGELRDWEIVNRPAKGFSPAHTFFALWAKPAGGAAVTRALEGPLDPVDFEGHSGCKVPNHGLPRFRNCSFHAAYPLAQVTLSDPDVPLDARIEAFNPLVPADAAASSVPAAILRFVLRNKTAKPVSASVCGSLENFIGFDGQNGSPRRNVNRFKKAKDIQGILMSSLGVDKRAEQWGTIALATVAARGVSCRTSWTEGSWNIGLLDFWDDFSADGKLDRRKASNSDNPHASLAVSVEVPPRGSRAVTFLLAWHFPNRYTWTPTGTSGQGEEMSCCEKGKCNPQDLIGNHYATCYRDAWDAARSTASALAKLEERTVRFVRAFCESDLPRVAKEAALFNLSTLRSQTVFRTPDGSLFGWEGCCDRTGCCYGSCTHVWNYEQATAHLFGELAVTMREVEFRHATDERGLMSFRVNLPLSRAKEYGLAAADGQMGCLMKLYRDWRLSGDDRMLRRLWPKARKALEFCWIKGGWDADCDGVMEGCQHNTMDVEYYGPNPQMGVWYLGALRAAEEMARYLGDADFARKCARLFASGSRWIDENLFNGEYYEHEIRPPESASAIAPGLRHKAMGAKNLKDPELQLGAGCLVDQLVGQFMAHVCGLGYLLKVANVRRTLRSIMKYNFKKNLRAHFNSLRSFALGDEAALLMATYPKGRRPKRPFPYFTEVMTGFEYTAAVGMLYEGQTAAALKCIEAIRSRYDGRRRSPFDEAECGHHYARAMASWAAVLAWTGFRYNGVEKSLSFARSDGKVFWSTGYGWGTCTQKSARSGVKVQLKVLGGSLELEKFVLAETGALEFKRPRKIREGSSATFTVPANGKS